LKEYKDAEAGRTQGIVLAERKSKKTKKQMCFIKKTTCFFMLSTFFVAPIGYNLMHQTINDIVDLYVIDFNN